MSTTLNLIHSAIGAVKRVQVQRVEKVKALKEGTADLAEAISQEISAIQSKEQAHQKVTMLQVELDALDAAEAQALRNLEALAQIIEADLTPPEPESDPGPESPDGPPEEEEEEEEEEEGGGQEPPPGSDPDPE